MTLSCIILTRNEEKMISRCIRSLEPLNPQEIIIIDDNSTDRTVSIAKKLNAKVYSHTKIDFAESRNFGMAKTRSEWVLYIDADEAVSVELTKEILREIQTGGSYMAGFALNRVNYYLGKPWPKTERVIRLFRKSAFSHWFGQLHESPKVEGAVKDLNSPLYHYTHQSLTEMIENTIDWSEIEAKLRLDADHPQMSWWRFPRVMLPVFIDYFVIQGGWKVGTVGLIESVYQAFSIFITYARLWEMQQEKNR